MIFEQYFKEINILRKNRGKLYQRSIYLKSMTGKNKCKIDLRK